MPLARPVVVTDQIREAVRQVLPFKLTGDQYKVLGEIVRDMQRPQPMNRLLQGDVGSGKTIVALMAALGPSVVNVIVAIAVVYSPRVARVVRGSVLVSVCHTDLGDAGEVLGALVDRQGLDAARPELDLPGD